MIRGILERRNYKETITFEKCPNSLIAIAIEIKTIVLFSG